MKEILLFTVPHSGTHTMHYLFNALCGVRVWWLHYERQNINFFDQLLDSDWEEGRFVHVQTCRSAYSLEESFRRRNNGSESNFPYLHDCLDKKREYFGPLADKFGEPHMIHIEATPAMKSEQAESVFAELDVLPSHEATQFMHIDNWPRINAGVNDNHELRKAAKTSILSSHVTKLLEELY